MGMRKRYSANLSSLLVGVSKVPAALDVRVHGITLDSRRVTPGDLFLAVAGLSSESTAHIAEALEKGAAAIVVEGEKQNGRAFEDGDAVEIYVADLKAHLGSIANRFYQAPSRDLRVIGVTGTNGKTSVTHYLAQFLCANSFVCGVIGTLGYGMPYDNGTGATFIEETSHTTPDVVTVHAQLAALRDAGGQAVAMEVSSHGLDQERVAGVHFDTAIFTNLSRDHLDYHQNMASYAAAKQKLFAYAELNHALINIDDAAAAGMLAACKPNVHRLTFGVNESAAVRAEQSSFERGITAKVVLGEAVFHLQSQLMGDFNLSNLLAVAALAKAWNLPPSSFAPLNSIRAVNGRMEAWQAPNGPRVVVDYAHTPDALENALRALRPQTKGRLLLVFGCGGDRDRGKRPQMGAIAEEYADWLVVCDDNPRSEDPAQICADIIAGMQSHEAVNQVHDRAAAIALALEQSHGDDTVLIAGKGHETYQEQNGQRTDFHDLSVAQRAWQVLQDSVGEGVS